MIDEFRYNAKAIFSPLKWVMCLLFALILPFFLYTPTFYNFTYSCEIFMPFIGIILFSDIILVDNYSNFEEIRYINVRKHLSFLFYRAATIVLVILFFVLLDDFVYNILVYVGLRSYGGDTSLSINQFQFIIVCMSSTLYLGSIALIVSNILKNPYIGYAVSFIVWMYWNVNITSNSVFNPFPVASARTGYIKYDLFLLIFSFILFFLNIFIIRRSPFYIEEFFIKTFPHFSKNQ